MELNSSTNYSLDPNSLEVKTQLTLYNILIPAIGLFIIFLNLLVVLSSGLILKKGQEPRSTYLFLGNVALTDLITGFAVVFGQLYPKDRRTENICAFQLGLIVSATLASIYSVGLIAFDRFLYILYGLNYQRWVYPKMARLLICSVWIFGCIIGYLPLFGWRLDTNNGKYCWFINLAPKNLILLTVSMGAIPIIFVIILYSIILYHAIKKIIQLKETKLDSNLRMFRGQNKSSESKDNLNNTNNNQDQLQPSTKEKKLFAKLYKKASPSIRTPSKWKAIKVVLFTCGSFFITWSPYFITSIIYVYQCENIDTKKCKSLRIIIASPLAILGFANSLINPIIYAWWHKGFRNYVDKKINTVRLKARSKNIYKRKNQMTNTTLDTDFTNKDKF